jgi:8-amino-7-oxononanoate synthase
MADWTHHTLAWIDTELRGLEEAGTYRRLATREGVLAPHIVLNGQELLHFGSNDYLGLASDPRLKAAAQVAIEQYGWGSGASPLILGHSALHQQLEERIARFEGTEAALVFPSGFAANAGTVAALVGPGDVVFTDRNNHASLLDGCRLSRADVRTYPHADWQELKRLLGRRTNYRRRLIVTDSLFSMDGDFAPLAELADLADRYEAMLMVDEAHATGVFGLGGRGLVEQLGIEARVPVRVGTLSKALGGVGGFVAGSRTLVDWLVNRARSYIYSTAAPPAVAAAALAAIEIVEREPHRRTALLDRAAQLREQLAARGWNIGRSASQIIPIVMGEPERAVSLAAKLRQQGLFVPAIRPPTVPKGESCLRVSLTFAHSEEAIDQLLAALEKPDASF